MSINEINPGNGLETGVDSSTGLPGSISDINRDPFKQPPSKVHSTLVNISTHPLLNPADGLDTGASHDSSINATQTKSGAGASLVYGDEFESGIPPIDSVARQVGKALDAVDKIVEDSTPSVRQFISETVTQISEATQDGIDTARKNWSAPDNELREALTDRVQRGVGLIRKWVTNLSENRDVRELVDSAITVGRNLAEKTGDVIQNAQVAAESWLDGAYNETYFGNVLPSRPSNGGDRLNQSFIGVIDTGFEAQDHGTQVIDVIQRVGHQFPDWLADSVGSGTWSKALVNFVDAAKARGHSNAVINLSFDLTQTNPDGSVSTRYELTAAEREALKYAQANRVLVVASAGNQGGAMSALGQASQEFDNVIAVGATEAGKRAGYSSYGAGLDFVASGQGREAMGTSLAAARVTGAIAKIWDANPQLDYRQVVQTLESTAIDLQKPGWDSETGYGELNTSAAIDLADDLIPQPQSRSTQVLPTIKRNQAEDLHNDVFEHESSTWQLNGAIASERPNRVSEGTGSETIPAPALNLNYGSANAAERWNEADEMRYGSADAAAAWHGEEIREPEPSSYEDMSANAAEHWIENAPAPNPITPSVPNLKYEQGAPLTYDPAVKQWQQRMKDQGYAPNIAVDGFYGPESEQVARKFQEAQGLEVDGVVGPKTWDAAFKAPLQPVSIAATDHADETATESLLEVEDSHSSTEAFVRDVIVGAGEVVGETASDLLDTITNPMQAVRDTWAGLEAAVRDPGQVARQAWDDFTEPYEEALDNDRPGQAVGRAVVEVVTSPARAIRTILRLPQILGDSGRGSISGDVDGNSDSDTLSENGRSFEGGPGSDNLDADDTPPPDPNSDSGFPPSNSPNSSSIEYPEDQWWEASNFGPNWWGTRVPRSFNLRVDGQIYHVVPNATEHLDDYVYRAKRDRYPVAQPGRAPSGEFPLSPLAAAIEQAQAQGLKPGRNSITVGAWELGIDVKTNENVIYHAVYRP
ncbi:S8 family serine peptidase [Leptolyngbya sp. FACHB-711]|uniref:S8 family serine peptidase n=1 Tax=Leptolyngbya sp. FACHB-711 TaxID=2692813 RepID=UPI001688C873|nr:S8 family serine peptidase [Leptolyngbya sp. FACHB-711]MBD2028252.1 S8 family serine peptidase [Leptolyngbya sp. FACHB-711]